MEGDRLFPFWLLHVNRANRALAAQCRSAARPSYLDCGDRCRKGMGGAWRDDHPDNIQATHCPPFVKIVVPCTSPATLTSCSCALTIPSILAARRVLRRYFLFSGIPIPRPSAGMV